jgi:septal ring factor EnvC (AmiA/AmiB activator)
LGASRKFILRLFTVEGLAQGLVGSGVGLGILLGMVALLSTRMGAVQLPGRLFAAAGGTGLLLGLVANWFLLRRLIIIVAAFVLATVPVRALAAQEASAEEIGQYQQELSQIKEELRQSRAGAAEIEREEQTVLKELDELNGTVDELEQQIEAGEARIATNRAAAEKIQSELGPYEKRYAQSRQELEQWLRLLCNRREPTMFEVILNDIPQSQITRRREIISLLVKREAESFKRVQELRSAVLERREALARRAEWDALYYETVTRQAERSRGKKSRRETLLAQIREEKNIFQAAINDMDASARELHELLETQGQNARTVLAGAVPFREMKGLLLWPADGEVTAGFGRVRNQESTTYTRHVGLDIAAAAESPIRAIHDAVVVYNDWFGGYGKLVILDHGGGYSSVYAHCSEMLVNTGDKVRGGQPIALVGETGSLRGPYLYFEIREQGQPVDPTLWLQRRNTDAAQSE